MTPSDSRLLQAAFAATADAAVITDAAGRIRWANPAFTTLTGWPVDEVLGRTPSFLKSGEHDEPFYRRLWDTIRGGSTWRGQIVNRRKNGARYTEEQTITPLAEQDEIIGYIALKHDVSARERRAAALAQREARYRALLANMRDVVYVVDSSLRILYVSPSVERVFGYRPEERLGRSPFDLIHPDDLGRLSELLTSKAQDRGFAATCQYRLRHRDGSWRWVEAVGVNRLDDPMVGGAVITVRDITERHEAEVLQAQMRARLAQSDKLAALGELLSGVAHELNNPLSVVIGYATLLGKAEDAGVRERAEKISVAAMRCGRIVKSFLAVAREHPPERQRVSVNELIHEAVELIAYPLRVDSVAVVLELGEDHPKIAADPHQIQQVLVNLLTNGYHAVRTQPGPRTILVVTRLRAVTEEVEIEITDSGPGIPPDVEARILDPFFTTKPVGQGTGLGLPICKGIVEAHDGRLEIEGRPGRGARFRVVLPVGRQVEDAPPGAPPAVPRAQGEAVLVVDDEPFVAEMLNDGLTRAGYTVETAPNGRVALEKIAARDFHAVLTDIKMPELDGPGLYRALAASRPDLLPRVAFMTGDILGPGTSAFLREVASPRLTKPFDLAEAAALVGRLVHAA